MEERKVWQVLGIAPVKDKEKIRAAYRKQLMSTHPEEDEVGFKRLRQSYEQALAWADTAESEQKEETPVSRWIGQVSSCYASFSKRCSIEVWHELLEQEVCQSLDSSNEACEALLCFLMTHYYLPHSIWCLINQVFCIVTLKETFYEKFPRTFIDYVIRQIETGSFIELSLFEGPDEGPYDTFISGYFEIKDLLDQKKIEAAENKIKEVEQLAVSHPLLTAEKIRLALYKGQYQEAERLVEGLQGTGKEQPYISLIVGMVKWEKGEIEEAGKIWQSILAAHPHYDGAAFQVVRYEFEIGKYKEAKEHCLELFERLGSQETLITLLQKINDKLLEQFEKEWQDQGTRQPLEDEALRFEMAWCYFQNKRFKACDALLCDEPSADYAFEFNNLKGRNYLADSQFKEALPYLKAWLNEILALTDDGTEKTRKRLERKGYAYYTVGICYEALNDEEKAKQYFLAGSDVTDEDAINCQKRLIDLYLKTKDYKACVDLCSKLIEQDNGAYTAYLYRQRAYYGLKDGQHVIDDLYHCIRLYPDYYEPYMLAMKVFIAHDQVEDALSIYKQAEENEVVSQSLVFYACQCRRMQADTKEQLQQVIKELEQLKEGLVKDKGDIEDLSEVFGELALCYVKFSDDLQAMITIEEAIARGGKQPKYLWIKADILVRGKKYKEALALQDELVVAYAHNPEIYFDRGINLQRLGEEDRAALDLEQVIRMNPLHPNAYGRIAEIYLDRYSRLENKADYKRAVWAIEKQMTINANSYYGILQGLIYLEGYQLEEALNAFKEVAKAIPDDFLAYNNISYTYKIMGQYDEAIQYSIQAVSKDKNNTSNLPYYNMAVCYLILGKYQEALEATKRNLERFPSSLKCRHLLEEIVERQKQYDLQIHLCKEAVDKDQERKSENLRRLAEAFVNKENHLMARYYYWQSILSAPHKVKGWLDYGTYLLENRGSYGLARLYLINGLEKATVNSEDYRDCCIALCRVSGQMKDQKTAKLYFDKAIVAITHLSGNLQYYLTYPGYAPFRYYSLGLMYNAIGEEKEAAACFEKVAQLKKCKNCHYRGCINALLGEAFISEKSHEEARAYALYRQVLEEEPANGVARRRLKRLKKRVGGSSDDYRDRFGDNE